MLLYIQIILKSYIKMGWMGLGWKSLHAVLINSNLPTHPDLTIWYSSNWNSTSRLSPTLRSSNIYQQNRCQVAKCICLKLQNVFVSNCKMYLSQISKCICLKLQNVYFPDTALIKYLSTKQVSGGSQDKLCTILKCILSVKFIQLKQLFWRKRGICFPPPTLLYCF